MMGVERDKGMKEKWGEKCLKEENGGRQFNKIKSRFVTTDSATVLYHPIVALTSVRIRLCLPVSLSVCLSATADFLQTPINPLDTLHKISSIRGPPRHNSL
jgi:hypothetical protein